MRRTRSRGLARSKASWGLIGNGVRADSVSDGEEMEKEFQTFPTETLEVFQLGFACCGRSRLLLRYSFDQTQ